MRESSDQFGFLETGEDLDIAAIFGDDAAIDPPPAVPQETAIPKEENPHTAPTPDASAQGAFSAFTGENRAAPAVSGQALTEPASIFDRPPVFSYGGIKEPLQNSAQTFEELRQRKAEDFPELEEAGAVSWRIKYGDISKSVSSPKEKTIAAARKEIETSKTFLDSLRKGKVKDPVCLVIPSVTAKSKGIACYKGVFPTLEAARASEKAICLIPARDGLTYELRRTELGEFIAPKSKVVDFAEVKAGFTPALPRIPRGLMARIIAFFRRFLMESGEYEVMIQIYWDRVEKKYLLFVPEQSVSKTHIAADPISGAPDESRYLCCFDCHSHNSMEAYFSQVDDRDEKATRIYIVLGHLERFYPTISVRFSCGGISQEIDPGLVLEELDEPFPEEWLDRVKLQASKEENELTWRNALVRRQL